METPERTLRQKIDRVMEMLDPAFDWEAYWETEESNHEDSLDNLFRQCIVVGFPEGSASKHYRECGSTAVEDTSKALYRLLYLARPKSLDFSTMYKSWLFGFFSADRRFLVSVEWYKYELGLYFYCPKEAIGGRGHGVQMGMPGADNGWHVEDPDGRAFFDMVTKAVNSTWMVYPGNDFTV